MKHSPIKVNLFIIGSMKSGTTSLHEYLNLHPDIFMSPVKEPGHFTKEVDYYPKSIEWYHGLFKDAGNVKYLGESSTHYTKLPTYNNVARDIYNYNPDARLIYIMRNPVRRTISHYYHNKRKEGEFRPIISAIKTSNEYISYSDYEMQLDEYYKYFDKKNIYILSFEELLNSTDSTLKRIFNWLNIDTHTVINHQSEIHNAMPDEFKSVKGHGFLYRIRNSKLWSYISPYTPDALKRLAINISEKDDYRNLKDDIKAIEYLNSIFSDKIISLEHKLDRNFDEWKHQ